MTPQILIQCAKDKNQSPFYDNGNRVCFVATPDQYPNNNDVIVNPNDEINNENWIERIRAYNDTNGNPSKLLPAIHLYKDPIYKQLEEAVGINNTFILSAGWGLVSGSFLLPNYDITFSKAPNVPEYTKRDPNTLYDWDDINAFDDISISYDDLHVFCVPSYYPLLNKMLENKKINNIILHVRNSNVPNDGELNFQHISRNYKTKRKINWHYACARDFINKLR